jgi:Phage-related minor tail protein
MLDAGSVITTLGGKLDPAGFNAFAAANKKAAASAEDAEARMTAASRRAGKAQDDATASSVRAAAANDAVSSSAVRMGNSLPLRSMDAWAKNSTQASQNLSKLGSVAGKTAAVGIVAVGAATVYAAAKAASFNQEMLRLHTQAGATTDEVARFKGAVLDLAGTVPQGPKELSEGLYHIVSAGFRGSEALKLLEASAKGAALGNADLQDTSNALIGTLVSHVKGVKNAADAQGQLNAIVGVGNMRFEDLDKAIGVGVLPTFAEAGLELRDFGAALATVTDNSTPANVTATRLRMTIAQMVDPTKAATAELKSIGLTSTSLADDLRQPNGLLVAVEDLKTHLQDSGKTAVEQDQVLSAAFGRGKSSSTIMTLVDEVGRLRSKYRELGETNGVKRLNQDWSAFEKSESSSFKQLKSGAEAFAITVGDVVLPSMVKLSKAGENALQGFISSGGAEKVGNDLAQGFQTAGQVISNIAPDVEALAKAAVDLGKAAGLGNAAELTGVLAGFVAFKSVSFVAPILLSIAGAMSTVGLAAKTAPSIGAFVADLSEAGVAVPILGAVVAVAAGAFVALQSGLFSSASAAEKNAAALQHDKEAMQGLNSAVEKQAQAHTQVERSALNRKKAEEQLAKVDREIRGGHLTGSAASNAHKEASLGLAEAGEQELSALHQQTEAIRSTTTEKQKALTVAKAGERDRAKELEDVKALIALHPAGNAEERRIQQEKLNEAQSNFNRTQQRTAQLTAEVQVKQESLNRAAAGQKAISSANAQGVAQLQNALAQAHAPSKLVTKYELDAQGAQAQLGRLAATLSSLGRSAVVTKMLTTAPSAGAAIEAFKAVLHGVPPAKVVSILHNAPSAKSAMAQLASAIRAVPSSHAIHISSNAPEVEGSMAALQNAVDSLRGAVIKITREENVVKRGGHASGRGAGPGETAVVGEGRGPEYVINSGSGRGFMVTSPSLVGLAPDDYVVPLEDRYRGRALGLFAQLARDLEVPGYKAGRGKAKPMPIPDAIKPLSLPLSEIEAKQQAAHESYDKAASKVNSLTGQVHTAERNVRYAGSKGTARAKDRAKLDELKGELAKAKSSKDYTVEHKRELEWAQTLRKARAFQVQINSRTLEANNAGNAMKIAAAHHDEAAYDAAKGKRLGALGALQGLIRRAQAQVKTGSEYALTLEGQLQGAQQEAEATEAELNPELEGEERSGMTPAQVVQLKSLEEAVALSALTAGLGDDTTAAQNLVGFLQGVLGQDQSAQGPLGSAEAITSVANALKTAQSNLASLTGGGGSNENADTQAQIDQATQRAEEAQQKAQTAERALQVFSGSGDIGQGGQNASAAVVQNIYTLHPGDPQTQLAIGNAAVAGIGLQGSRRAVRVGVGP